MATEVFSTSRAYASGLLLVLLAACSAAKAPIAHNPTHSPLAAEVATPFGNDAWSPVGQTADRKRNINLLPRPTLAPQSPTLPLRTALWPLPRRPQETPWLTAIAPQQPCQRSLNNYWQAWCLYRSGEYQKAIHQMALSLGARDPTYATAARIDLATMAGFHPDPQWLIEHRNGLAASDREAFDAVIASLLMLGKLDQANALETALIAGADDTHRLRVCERQGRRLQIAAPLDARSRLEQPRPNPICATINHLECAAALQAPASAKLSAQEFWILCGFSRFDQPELSAQFNLSADYITWDVADSSADTWYRTAADATELLALAPAAEPMFEAALRNYIAVAGCISRAQTETAKLVQPYLQYLDLHYRTAPAYLHRLTSITAENCAAIQAELRAAPVASPP